MSTVVMAQQTQVQPLIPERKAPQPVRNSDGVLQLEATIRSSKEQPRVLSIVPWQQPRHKSIGQNQHWRLGTANLRPIERGQFRRELALRQQLWSSPTTAVQTYASPAASGVEH